MAISSDLVNIAVINPLFYAHLPTVATKDGESFTSTSYITKLTNNHKLFKQLKEEDLHNRMMRNRQPDDGGDPTYVEKKEKYR